MPPLNEYDQDTPARVVLTDVRWDNGQPIPDFAVVVMALEPNGPATLRGSVHKNQEPIAGAKDGATKTELDGFEPCELSFEIELLSDDEDGGLSALDKFEAMWAAFRGRDSNGTNRVYGVQYPTVDRARLGAWWIDQFEVTDQSGADWVLAKVTLVEHVNVVTGGAGGGGNGSSGGSGGGGGSPSSGDPGVDKADDAAGKSKSGSEKAGQSLADKLKAAGAEGRTAGRGATSRD